MIQAIVVGSGTAAFLVCLAYSILDSLTIAQRRMMRRK